MPEARKSSVLELGCGVHPTAGALHHDRIGHSPHVDVAHDLEELPWPWPDEGFETVIAFDVMGHLTLDVAHWLDEAWRILRPAGRLQLRLPAFDNPLSYRDPTQRRVFHEETFYYWQPGHPLYEAYGQFYFAESGRWWDVIQITRTRPDPRSGVGDLAVELRKRGAAPRSDHPALMPVPGRTPRSPRFDTGGALPKISQPQTMPEVLSILVGMH
jgi:SAM-dependent methyltransferase